MPTALAGARWNLVPPALKEAKLPSCVSFSSKHSYRKGQLEPYPPARPSHRRLIAIVLAVVIGGSAFLFFWQTVLQFAFLPQEFGDDLCIQLLRQYQPELQVSDFVEASLPGEPVQRLDASFFDVEESRTFSLESADGRLRSCGVQINTNEVMGGYVDPYDCDITTVRYRSEENPNFLLVASQTEFPEALTLAGLQRYNYLIVYFSPDARDSYNELLGQYQQHFCGEEV